LQIFNAVLAMNLFNGQVITFQDDLQKELSTSTFFKHRSHEIIINQPQSTQPLQIFFMFPFKIQFLL